MLFFAAVLFEVPVKRKIARAETSDLTTSLLLRHSQLTMVAQYRGSLYSLISLIFLVENEFPSRVSKSFYSLIKGPFIRTPNMYNFSSETADFNELMELDNVRPKRCKFCLRHFKYDHSLVMHLKENHMLQILRYKRLKPFKLHRSSVIVSNPHFRK